MIQKKTPSADIKRTMTIRFRYAEPDDSKVTIIKVNVKGSDTDNSKQISPYNMKDNNVRQDTAVDKINIGIDKNSPVK